MDVSAVDVSAFEAERARLTAIASRILGSPAEADDVVQDAWLRLSSTDDVEDLPAWLTTVTTRLCLDRLRKRRTRAVVEDQLVVPAEAQPEAVDPGIDPEAEAMLAEQVGEAMYVVLDTLAPAERAAFVLHDVFGYSFDEISGALGRSATAVRQLASRARRKVQGTPETSAERAARAENRRVVEAFLAAARGGELDTLMALLAPDVVMRADLVGQRMGAQRAYDGPEAVAARFNGAQGAAPALVDDELAGAWIVGGAVKVAFLFQVEAGRVQEIELIADPDVLNTLDVSDLRR
jgi:RNA polymerase sigma-70 factor (ECF subfamily)